MRKLLRELAWLALIIIGVLAARSSLADHYYVPSGSMEHTLYAGDRVFVDKRAYGLRLPFSLYALTDGGDVVIFDSPRDGKRLIKRVVGTAGDTVAIIDGHLIVNGQSTGSGSVELIGGRRVNLNLDGGGGIDFVATIPRGQVLAVGDNRGNSLDGRVFGYVDETAIYGRAVAIYYRKGKGAGWSTL